MSDDEGDSGRRGRGRRGGRYRDDDEDEEDEPKMTSFIAPASDDSDDSDGDAPPTPTPAATSNGRRRGKRRARDDSDGDDDDDRPAPIRRRGARGGGGRGRFVERPAAGGARGGRFEVDDGENRFGERVNRPLRGGGMSGRGRGRGRGGARFAVGGRKPMPDDDEMGDNDDFRPPEPTPRLIRKGSRSDNVRNRRMFGFLMNTLGSAQKAINKDLKDTKHKLREDVDKRVQRTVEKAALTQQENARRRAQRKAQRKLFQERYDLEVAEYELILAKNAELIEKIKKEAALRCKYILTKTEPHVLYLPKKMNSDIETLLAASQPEHEKLLESEIQSVRDAQPEKPVLTELPMDSDEEREQQLWEKQRRLEAERRRMEEERKKKMSEKTREGVEKLIASSNLPRAPPPELEDSVDPVRVKKEGRTSERKMEKKVRKNVTDISADDDVDEDVNEKPKSKVKQEVSADADADEEDAESEEKEDAEAEGDDDEEEEVLADFEE